MPDGPNAGQSYEAWVESMAGASPPETYLERQARLAGPQAVEDCANQTVEDARRMTEAIRRAAKSAGLPESPEFPGAGRAHATPVAPEAAQTGAPNDWPQPVPPPYEADDEDEATPDE